MMHTMTLCHQRSIGAGDNALLWQLPSNPVEFGMFERVEFLITVTEATGGASSWQLDAKFQIGMENRRTFAFSDAILWRDLEAAEVTNMIEGGTAWSFGSNTAPTIFTNTDGTSKIARRVMTKPANLMRIVLAPTFTGGTSPKLAISAIANCYLSA